MSRRLSDCAGGFPNRGDDDPPDGPPRTDPDHPNVPDYSKKICGIQGPDRRRKPKEEAGEVGILAGSNVHFFRANKSHNPPRRRAPDPGSSGTKQFAPLRR